MQYDNKERFIKVANSARQHMVKLAEGGGLADLWNKTKAAVTSDKAIGAGVGALGGGSAATILALLLKQKRAWAYGLGGAAIGAGVGGHYGSQITNYGKGKINDVKAWFNAKKGKQDKTSDSNPTSQDTSTPQKK